MHTKKRSPAGRRQHWPVLGLVLVAGWASGTPSQSAGEGDSQLIDLSLEQLVDVEITSVSKKSQRLSEAPAAIFVITGDDIRRSGVTSIPEALRLAPGIEVAKIDSNKWAITSRGFNGRFANKLLVLMDGRSIYSPLFSGVLWEVHDAMLEDIERIEVIRGPGATLWGANAVNGVINIITRHTRETQGGLLSVTVGSEERGVIGFRQGGTTEQGTAWRAYGKVAEHDALVDASGARANDEWRTRQVGFRTDGRLGAGTTFTFQGDAYKGAGREALGRVTLAPPYSQVQNSFSASSGLNLLGRLNRITDSGEMTFQAYYDGTRLEDVIVNEDRDTLDLDFQHRLPLVPGQDLIWGLGYRLTQDRTRAGMVELVPSHRTDQLFSGFVQDEIALADTVRLTLGTKIEHNDYTGWEFQPSVRALWKPVPWQSAWGSVSRAIRTPSRADATVRLDLRAGPNLFPPVPVLVQATGSRDMDSERLVAYEVGWRLNPNPAVALDLTAFLNDYDRLRSQELGTPYLALAPVPHLVQPVLAGNLLEGRTYGFEAVVETRPAEHWRLVGTYSNLHYDLRVKGGSTDTTSIGMLEGSSPRNQYSLRSEWSITPKTDFDAWIKRVDKLPGLNVGAYTSLNLRVAYRPRRDTEISLVGQNLLDNRHLEFVPEFVNSALSQVQRALLATVRLRF
ncbi:MAG TPA: TonB-dependent receptor [Rhodocyclaceae bacterium]|nr:TonB-dependent receptor [Rhodocyclaceae bacterium]